MSLKRCLRRMFSGASRVAWVLAAFAVMVLPVSCSQSSDSYNPLIKEYNKNFTVVADDAAQFSVNDAGFNEVDMLRDLYNVSNRAATTLTIIGPRDGIAYTWQVLKSDGTALVLNNVNLSSQTFSAYLPEVPAIEVGVYYTLTLAVRNSAGRVFSDSGRLYIENE